MAGLRGGGSGAGSSLPAVLTVVLAVAVIAFSGWVLATYPRDAPTPDDSAPPVGATGEEPTATPTGTAGTSGASETGGAGPRIAVIGDGYTAGSPVGGQGDKAWPQLLADRADVEVETYAAAGDGYLTGGFDDAARKVVDAWSDDASPDDVVMVLGGRSDAGADPAEVEAATVQTLELLVDGLPEPSVVVVGPLWPAAFPPAGGPELRDAVAAGAEAAGVTYVDPLDDPWLPASTPGVVADDDVLPTNLGHGMIATRVREVLADAGLLEAASRP